MRLTSYLLSVSLIAGSAVSYAAATSRPYSRWMADSMIARPGAVPATRYYGEATFYRGVEAVYNATGDSSYRSYLISQMDAILTANGSFRSWDYADHQLDNIRVGSVLLYLHSLTHDAKYKAAADFLHDQLVNKQKRTPSGGFWHKDPKYPNQMWLDGLYMAGPFYAQYNTLFNASAAAAWDDVLLQFSLVEKHCRDATTGMLRHGYDESRKAVWADPVTGASPHVWDRAQGWYLMALVDVLDWFPPAHAGHAQLLGWLRRLASALKTAQDGKSGGWWLVMDAPYPGQKGNYIESSGTAMYTYGLLKGVRLGYLAEGGKEYVGVAERAYQLMVDRFLAKNGTNGTLNWEGTVRVGSLDTTGDFTYYTTVPVVENSVLGFSPFILASVEMEARNKTSARL
ncbi:putative cell wall glycosyl hydrolase YteR [Podospora appendiculata]|uniref:Cell wall glycosyl hydrolase YteR n=1 Tax=Podospora appendiculata TaxID=314037 RepID=A0AAE0XBT3_9PEZI|nr:putative cell wall glycosyl hydrolase YteR [Podospora appendiculata]